MATIEAKLISLNLIEVKIKNNYYNGETCTLTLKKGKNLFDLVISKVEKFELETVYLAKLERDYEFGEDFEVLDDHGLRTSLIIDSIVRTKEFDELFYYDGEIGNFYTKIKTEFKVWSPISTQVKLELKFKDHKYETYEMTRINKGIWTVSIDQDLEGVAYVYLLKINGAWNEAIDPYAFSSTPNHKRSVVIDLEKTKIDLNKDKLPVFESFTDAIIYEMHIRDFTVNPNGNIKNKGKFLGVIEEGTKSKLGNPTGFDYIKSLGITHLQILPVYDFGSVDEENQFKFYNWGYDPVQFNVPEGSYATDVYNPYSRVLELKQMVSKLHKAGLRVNIDVVYNHMFDMVSSSFHHIMPGYYFRFGKNNELSNGSFCGNDTDSNQLMMRKFIVDSCLRWINFYGFDGFRFDLMGIIDIDTMNLIRNNLNEINCNIMLYGEGWHMPTLLDDEYCSSMRNYRNLQNIGHFNDYYRDTMKGPHHNLNEKGFALGNLVKTEEAMFSLLGTSFPVNDKQKPYLGSPTISLNYNECHDNYTLFDQLSIVLKDTSVENIQEKHRLITGLLFVAQGIPFLHGGQEFFRTKNGIENSYKSPDLINWFDWDLKDVYLDNVNYIKGLIEIRKSFIGFRLTTPVEIKSHVTISTSKPGLIDYQISYNHENYRVLINVTDSKQIFELNTIYDILANKYEASVKSLGVVANKIEVEKSSFVILRSKQLTNYKLSNEKK
ncbi:MAG: pullulanase [Haloplasmataceae bacterium]|nr:pullulanase [Haloplasmataceae bacterium]